MTEKYPYGYCGMPCALCTRYRTDGKSRCPGCSVGGYYTDGCKVYRCCREKESGHCGNCGDFPCERLGKMGEFGNLRTNHAKERSCAAVAADGFDKWYDGYSERADLLTKALEQYNDGRMKRYICELFIQNDIEILRVIMRRAESITGTPKERGKAFRLIAENTENRENSENALF